MASRDDELEKFKRRIHLTDFAASYGFVVDRRKSSRQSCFMRSPSGEKIVVSLNAISNHWRYFSVSDPQDKGGTILDFTMRHFGCNLGQARKHLRPWLNSLPSCPPFDLEPTQPDVSEARRVFLQTSRPLFDGRQAYLNDGRGVPSSLLSKPHFADAVFSDKIHGNAVFPHRDHSGVTGCEMRNDNFRAFSKHGYKSLWFANPGQEERMALVIAEAAIDALSYACLFYDAHSCYMSTGGQLSPLQKDLLQAAMRKLPAGGLVTIAADNDDAGIQFAHTLQGIFSAVGRSDLHWKIHAPEQVNDWNDELQRMNTPKF